jgi:hypothetical protein
MRYNSFISQSKQHQEGGFMKVSYYETKNDCTATQYYKGGKHTVELYDDGGEMVGVKISAKASEKGRMYIHTSEMVPRSVIESMIVSLNLISVSDASFTMDEIMSIKPGLQ